jgi:hypothetical protein
MFCIQASRPRPPTAASEPATALRDSSGLPEKTGRISEIAPAPNSTITA